MVFGIWLRGRLTPPNRRYLTSRHRKPKNPNFFEGSPPEKSPNSVYRVMMEILGLQIAPHSREIHLYRMQNWIFFGCHGLKSEPQAGKMKNQQILMANIQKLCQICCSDIIAKPIHNEPLVCTMKKHKRRPYPVTPCVIQTNMTVSTMNAERRLFAIGGASCLHNFKLGHIIDQPFWLRWPRPQKVYLYRWQNVHLSKTGMMKIHQTIIIIIIITTIIIDGSF